MKLVDIIYWILNALMVASLIYGFITGRKSKKMIKDATEEYTNRLNLLSKENNKLRTENEMIKERLTNLGFKE